MKKLALAPDQNGYSVVDGVTAVYNKLSGGAGRLRKDYMNAPCVVELRWTCTEEEFNYLRTFYRTTSDGTEPFLMDLILHSPDLVGVECRFIPKTFKFSKTGAFMFTVQAQIEAVPPIPDDAYDEGLVTSYEAFGSEGSEAYALLAYIVNVLMPANIK